MGPYVLRRLLLIFPTLLGVYTVLFILLWALPGSPATVIAGAYSTREDITALKQKLHLDDPLYLQWFRYLSDVVRGDFGISYASGRPVLSDVMEFMPATLELTAAAMVVVVVIGIPSGVLSAVRRNSIFDQASRLVAVLGMSIPSFWLGILLILVFAFYLGLFPVSGRGSWEHLVLPAISLGIVSCAGVARMTRSCVLDVIHEPYIVTARAKGLEELRVIATHVLRNAMIPVITVAGYQMGILLTAGIVIETVFAWPGIGRLLVQSILARDFPTVQATVLVVATIFILVNLLVDIAYAYLDPRIRYA
jgi:peptide/nickel transport system permease protein